ncbi:uncharacterized protein [Blastocystis hominis]|uniref:Uncharacterized protein n=1 Tax=Blastocystis hominis TaxID=12968 RepID=D8M2K2_BLAHO|nr:uncharacterized protein [Blastocystis hominis]CBK22291.2 unnamed protein product [Blastocystis hominis]|eukprot:XP_012896339.1 uncharacterized protein [Blastocystis hominis]
MIWLDLPSLQSIELGQSALSGQQKDTSSSLIMRNLPSLAFFTSQGNSLQNLKQLTLENIPSLRTVRLPCSFQGVQSKIVSNVSSELIDLFGKGTQ